MYYLLSLKMAGRNHRHLIKFPQHFVIIKDELFDVVERPGSLGRQSPLCH